MKFLFEIAVSRRFWANRKFSSVNLGQAPVYSSGSGRKTQASSVERQRFSGTATGEKWTNVYFRLSVEDNCRDSVPTAPSRAVLAPPLHTPYRGAFAGRQKPNPADCSNTKKVSCKHLPPPSSQLCYRRACERELERSKIAFPLRGRWI